MLRIVMLMVGLGVAVGCGDGNGDGERRSSVQKRQSGSSQRSTKANSIPESPAPSVSPSEDNGVLKYRIEEKQDISYAGASRMTYRVVFSVEHVPSRADVEKTVNEIWRNYGRSFAEFSVFGYLPEMDTQSIAYIAAEYTPAGIKELRVQNYAAYGTKWWDAITNKGNTKTQD